MNLHSVFEELDKLYEAAEEFDETTESPSESEEQPVVEKLTEAAEEEIEIEIEAEDEEVMDEPAVEEAQLVLECAKCGGLVIKSNADVEVAEESDLANVDEACQYCEEAEGYKILGTLAPYIAAEEPTEEAEEIEDAEAVIEDAEAVIEESAAGTAKPSEFVWVVYDEYGEYVCSYPGDKEGEARRKAKELHKATVKKAEVYDDFGEGLQEGIFDSKATKEKNYKEVIKDVFKKDVTPLVFEISNNVTQLLHDATDGAKSTAEFAKNLQTMLKAIETAIKQRGAVNVLNTVINFGRKYAYESLYLEELTEQVKLMHKVKNTPKVGGKAYEYMHEKLAAEILKNLKNYQNHLSKEFG